MLASYFIYKRVFPDGHFYVGLHYGTFIYETAAGGHGHFADGYMGSGTLLEAWKNEPSNMYIIGVFSSRSTAYKIEAKWIEYYRNDPLCLNVS